MNWRPEGWEASASATAKQCAEDEKFKASSLENVIRGMFEAGADAMLIKVCEKIEKVKNPHAKHRPYPSNIPEALSSDGFEECRQKILTLLKGDK